MAMDVTADKTLNTENEYKCRTAKAEWLQEKQKEIEKMTTRQVCTKEERN